MAAEPGDLFVVRTRTLAGWVIRWFTRSPYSHAGIIVDRDGGTVEAKASGAVRGHLADYRGCPMLVGAPVPLTPGERRAIVTAAVSLLGTPYGWLDLLSLAALQYGIRPKFIRDRVARYDRLTCAELTDQAYRKAGIHLFADGRPCMDVVPGDLARLLEKVGPAARER